MPSQDEYFAAVFDVTPVGIAIADERGHYVDVNPTYCRMFGYAREELIGQSFRLILRPEDRHLEADILRMALSHDRSAPNEWQVRTRDGGTLTVRSSFRPLQAPDGSTRVVTALADVTALYDTIDRLRDSEHRLQELNADLEHLVAARTAELAERNRELSDAVAKLEASRARVEHLALHDPLTGLPNRTQLRQVLDEMLALPGSFGVLFIDLDGFKPVNDTLGHDSGDLVLVTVAQRLREALPAECFVGRLGGDEFVAVLPHTDRAAACAVGEKLIAALAAPIVIEGGAQCQLGASIGVALGPQHGRNRRSLLTAADRAMYAAKRSGKGRVAVAGEDSAASAA
ncbi:diguanylate cyclase [Azoarcus olearius]|uniref:GGDEF/PAS/PAC-domain containing protein n=1 Tax=Azoarcus sp. (strain BH72) TaxID=418699 RepID=A1K9H7_AZOSB|nr:diguanylate cyclase [Azoarcus olearius]CAL95482.1 GGDEF/PAS/PAC-domain containing protein [Azoarcus olearius]